MAEAKKGSSNSTSNQETAQPAVVVSATGGKQLKGSDGRDSITPSAVSRVYSSRGLEYLFMVVSLVVLTLGVAILGSDIISYLFDTSSVDGPLSEWAGIEAFTVVGAGFFFYLWSRLRATEDISPVVLADPSRKRALQRGLIIAFVSLLIASFAFVYVLFDLVSNGQDIVKTDWEAIVVSLYILGVVGGAFKFLFEQERKN